MAHLLEVNNLVTRFHTEEGTVHAVNGISYTLNEGESVAIVGESGCGKSVSVLSVLRLIPSPPGDIAGGEVYYAGRDLLQISEEEIRSIRGREIAMIFQDPMTSLNPVLTIERQMRDGLEYHMGMNKEQSRERSAEMLALVGIANPLDRLRDYPHQFSGGQRQRIMIAMALACNPSILIADEPTTALDVTIQAQITELVTQLKEKMGMAIIWITHDLGVVAGLVEKVIVMYAGFIVEMANVHDIYKATSHPYTLGLLQSLPKVTMRDRQRLIPIKGMPPDLLSDPTFCPYAPRCPFAIEKCWQELPALIEVGEGHSSACFRTAEVRGAKLAG
jgi:oligopeptide transport system ATP-binding protein